MINSIIGNRPVESNYRISTKHKQIVSEGTLIEGFETIGDWTVAGTGGTIEATSNCKAGLCALKINAASTNYVHAEKTVSLNLSASSNLILWVYIDDIQKVSYVRMTFYSTYSSVYYYYNFNNVSESGWNRLVIAKNLFTAVGSPNWASMVKLRFELHLNTSTSTYVILDDLRKDYIARPKVIITFDDTFQNVYDNAYPILTANRQKASIFMVGSLVGTSTFLTLDELHTLYNAGWDIGNHTWTHEHLTDISESAMHSTIDLMDIYLKTNGFASWKFFAPPGGGSGPPDYTQAVIDYLKATGHVFMRYNINPSYQPQLELVGNTPFVIHSLADGYNVSVATIEGYIDRVITQCGLFVIHFHQIVNTGADSDTKYLTSNFQLISDYIKIKVDAGLLDCVTLSEYYDEYRIKEELTNGSEGVIPIDDILDWRTNKYTPYTTQTTGCFDNSVTNPIHTTRLNYDGYLYATRFVAYGDSSNPAISVGASSSTSTPALSAASTIGGYTVSFNQIGTGSAYRLMTIGRTQTSGNVTGDIIGIYDNPSTGGTITGKVLTYEAGTTERISFNPRVGATGLDAYVLDTHNALTTSNLLNIKNQGVSKLFVNSDGEVELTTVSKGIILKSPDGTRYRLTVANGGTLTIIAA